MDLTAIVGRMEPFPESLIAALIPIDGDRARWRPPSGAWSVLEIVCHLADEEVDDFRTRVRMTLENPIEEWPPIDPEGVAVQRRYNDQDLRENLDRFAAERAASIHWLRSLEDPDWNRAYEHPEIGPIRAGDLLASWAAHDGLHLRQIAKRMFELASEDTPGFSTLYAGEWGA